MNFIRKVHAVKAYTYLVLILWIASVPAFASVTVNSPANGMSVSSPVHYVATSSSSTCAQGVAAMGIYVNNSLVYSVQASSLNTNVTLSPGTYYTVVQEWDNCGGSASTPTTITVPGAAPTQNGVTVSSPVNGSTSTSPVNYIATAGSTTCAAGVAAMGIYVSNSLVYSVQASSLNTNVTLSPGAHYTVVQEWDNCGGSASTPTTVTVPGAANRNGVTVSSPANDSTVTSPVNFAAAAGSATCAEGVAAMGIYVNNSLVYSVNGDMLNTQVNLGPGAQQAVVTEWDNCGGALSTAVAVTVPTPPTVSFETSPVSIETGSTSTLKVSAANATQVTVSGTQGITYTLAGTGGTQTVTPSTTTTYTATATGAGGTATATATVTVDSSAGVQAINHVIFMLQENHSFDNYFGMLNPYRTASNMSVGDDGNRYSVDGIDDKLTTIGNESDEGTSYSPFKFASTCVQDMTSSWLESYGDVSRYNFSLSRGINLDGFVHTSENYAKGCQANGGTQCAGTFSDFTGRDSMGYYDQGFLNYYYYMASEFALSDRWFSPVSSKSIPNRIATFTGGTTQGLAFDPGSDDHLSQLAIPTIFSKLASANVSWKIYYTVTQGSCLDADDCSKTASAQYPATDFSYLTDSVNYLYENPTGVACVAPTQASSVVGDTTNSFCIDPTHIAPLSTYYSDLQNGTLPSFAFIEAGYGVNDEHPGSGQSILNGQQEVASIVNALMSSSSWMQSVFFLAYDEGGGPYDHVPPVPGHSNDNTDAMVGSAAVDSIQDVGTISVNADSDFPCVPSGGTTATLHCDLVSSTDPGATLTDAPAMQGFSAQLGFRLPNMVISPYTRKHYVSHVPMDHTAILKFVESRFLGPSAHLTARDAAQPDLLDFFDFNAIPWATPPTPPVPVSPTSLGYNPCTPTKM
jgi:phospholipase C